MINNEVEYRAIKKSQDEKIFSEGLSKNYDWSRAWKLCGLKSYISLTPILNEKGVAITINSDYIRSSLHYFQESTGKISTRCNPRYLSWLPENEQTETCSNDIECLEHYKSKQELWIR